MAEELRHLPLVEQAAGMVSIGEALDLGSGRGNNSIYLAKKGFAVTAVELNKTAIEALSVNAKDNGVSMSIINQNIRDYSIENNRYSLIVATNILNFLSREDLIGMVNKIKKGLLKDGLCVIVLFTDKDPMHDGIRRKNTETGEREYKDGEGRRWYFPKENELMELFENDMEIIFYVEAAIEDKKGHLGQESPHSHYLARLIAKK